MSKLEDALREAMRREPPPAGFAERVMAKVELRKAAPGFWAGLARLLQAPRLRWAAVAACFVMLAAGAGFLRWRDERARAERAKDQYLLALRIAGDKLHVVQAKVQGIGRSSRN
jgi:hypothetical protein